MILSLILIAVVMTTSSSKTISNRDENSLQDERDQVQPQKGKCFVYFIVIFYGRSCLGVGGFDF